MSVRIAVRPCTLGLAGIAVGDGGVRVVALGDNPDALFAELALRLGGEPTTEAAADDPEVAAVLDAVNGNGAPPRIDLRGTEFQMAIWQALMGVPAGSTVSYAELAKAASRPSAVRAVGTACGANPVAVIVPCHRVLRSDGTLGGYRWGIDRKTALLHREGAAVTV